jgi:hypothetical protein
MTNIRSLLAVLLLAACNSTAERHSEASFAADSLRPRDTAGVAAAAPVAPDQAVSLMPFRAADGALDSVHVLRAGHLLQSLVVPPGGEPPPEGATDLDTVDINLDGHFDVQQQVVWGATGNAAFNFWLYDPAADRFVESGEYGRKLAGYRIDAPKREIVVRSNGGHAGAIFEMDVFQPRGDSLVRLRSVHQDWNDAAERYIRTTGSHSGGSWVEKVDTFTTETLPSADSISP